eukprot:2549878-Rhodomonas_salina.2
MDRTGGTVAQYQGSRSTRVGAYHRRAQYLEGVAVVDALVVCEVPLVPDLCTCAHTPTQQTSHKCSIVINSRNDSVNDCVNEPPSVSHNTRERAKLSEQRA